MRSAPALLFTLILAPALIAAHAHASVCAAREKAATQRWAIDRYIYDASLKQDWEVLVDCDHPAAPERIKLAPNPSGHTQNVKPPPLGPVKNAPPIIRAGAPVVVSGPLGSPATIQLSGTALETAFAGQPIRVRLRAGGGFITGVVRGPHSVEVASAEKTHWSRQ